MYFFILELHLFEVDRLLEQSDISLFVFPIANNRNYMGLSGDFDPENLKFANFSYLAIHDPLWHLNLNRCIVENGYQFVNAYNLDS